MTNCEHRARARRAFACAWWRRPLFVLFAFGLLGARLVYLQVYQHDELSTQAENNRIAVVPIVPNRGLILDRNGVVLANNYSAYTLEITPAQGRATSTRRSTSSPRSSTIQPRDRSRFKRLLEESKSFESLPIRTRLTDEEVARFTAQRFRFPGVEIKARLFRNYPLGEVGSHVIGYIGRINQAEKKQIGRLGRRRPANYSGTDYIGKLGVEQSYESELHGTTGFEEVEIDAGGRAVRALTSNPADARQHASCCRSTSSCRSWSRSCSATGAARWSRSTRSTGEVLAFVSKPSFDPEPVRRRHRRRELEGAERVARQAAAEPRAARHLSAGLDLQAVHGAGRARRSASARRSRRSTTPATTASAATASATTRKAATARSTCTSRSCSRATPTTTCSPTTSASTRSTTSWRRSASASSPASTSRASCAACCRRPSGSATPTSKQGAAEVVRRRNDLAGHRPGLQHLHDAAARAGDGDASPNGGAALQAAPGAGGRELRDAARSAEIVGDALPPLRLEARARRRHPATRWSA